MTVAAAVEDVQARVEQQALLSLYGEVHKSTRYEPVLEPGKTKWDGIGPLEVRDLASGQTFLLEVRALPTGG